MQIDKLTRGRLCLFILASGIVSAAWARPETDEAGSAKVSIATVRGFSGNDTPDTAGTVSQIIKELEDDNAPGKLGYSALMAEESAAPDVQAPTSTARGSTDEKVKATSLRRNLDLENLPEPNRAGIIWRSLNAELNLYRGEDDSQAVDTTNTNRLPDESRFSLPDNTAIIQEQPRTESEQQMDSIQASFLFGKLIGEIAPWAIGAALLVLGFYGLRGFLGLKSMRRKRRRRSRSRSPASTSTTQIAATTAIPRSRSRIGSRSRSSSRSSSSSRSRSRSI